MYEGAEHIDRHVEQVSHKEYHDEEHHSDDGRPGKGAENVEHAGDDHGRQSQRKYP